MADGLTVPFALREYEETVKLRDVELEEVATIFRGYGLEGATLDHVTRAIAADQKRWVDFMMRFELGLERPDPRRAPISAFTIAISYVVGGLIPLAPYILGPDVDRALIFCRVYRVCAGALWRRERPAYWDQYGQVGRPNHAGGWFGSRCGILLGVAVRSLSAGFCL